MAYSIALFFWVLSSYSTTLKAASVQNGECAIYRSVYSKTEIVLEQSQSDQTHLSELQQMRRHEVEICGDMQDIDVDGSEESETMVAESCPEPYRKWREAADRLKVSESEMENARRSLKMLTGHLERNCAPSASRSAFALR